jgi:hypothetical protein
MNLLMNSGGAIACAKHTPYVLDGWRRMRTSEIVDFRAELGRGPECEVCRAIARRHADGSHAERKSNECALCAGGAR